MLIVAGAYDEIGRWIMLLYTRFHSTMDSACSESSWVSSDSPLLPDPRSISASVSACVCSAVSSTWLCLGATFLRSASPRTLRARLTIGRGDCSSSLASSGLVDRARFLPFAAFLPFPPAVVSRTMPNFLRRPCQAVAAAAEVG